MTSNALTIILFLLASALILAIEAAKADTRIRYAFALGAGSFGLLALFWIPLADAFPIAARQVARVAQDPSSWFILLVVILLFARDYWRKQTTEFSDADWPAEAIDTAEALWASNSEIRKAQQIGADINARQEAEIAALRTSVDDLRTLSVKVNTMAEDGARNVAEVSGRVDSITGSLTATNHMVAEARATHAAVIKRLDRIDERFSAMAARIRLDYQEERMAELDLKLYFPEADEIRNVEWTAWEVRQKDWLSAVYQWADLAQTYSPNARQVIEHTPPAAYYGNWSFSDSDLPDANTIHKYKTFCIMRRNFGEVKRQVDGKVMVTSFG
jgi:hypothetical protein